MKGLLVHLLMVVDMMGRIVSFRVLSEKNHDDQSTDKEDHRGNQISATIAEGISFPVDHRRNYLLS